MRVMRNAILCLFATCLLTLAACGAPGSATGTASEGGPAADAAGGDLLAEIDASARVVALSRSLGETWLLAGGSLAGVTDDGLGLAGVTDDTADVGSLANPRLDAVRACKPDLVMLDDELPAHRELHDALNEAGVPVLAASVSSFDDYASLMERLTGATDRADLYDKNVTQVRARIDDVIAHAAQPDRGSFVVVHVSSEAGEASPQGESFVDAMLADLGLASASESLASEALSPATIAEADPDWVFVIYQGDAAEAQKAYEETFVGSAVWGELKATKAGHVVVLPQDLFAYAPNARWGEAYAYLSQVLHGAWA